MRGWAGVLRAAAAGPGPVPGGFRERFDFGGRDVASWFPGHMAKGLRQMRASLRRADCLIEVHDARISSGATTALHPAGCPPGQQESAPRAPSACTGVPPPPCHRVPQLSRLPPCRPFSQPHQLRHHQPPPGYLLPCQCTVTLLSGTHIPLSGRNPMLQEVLGIRPHILVLNKMDLADSRQQLTVVEHLKQQGCSHIVFTDCQRDGNVKKVMGQQPHAEPCSLLLAPEGLLLISQPHGAASLAHCEEIVPLVAKLVGNSPRYHRAESTEYSILVIGVPNVGKSSLINSLRRLHLKKGKATAVGGEPGITKAVLTRIQSCASQQPWLPPSQVCEKPLMYLVDTPGVLPPKLGDMETGMKLALCGAIRDHLVGEDIMADYLLYTLNKWQQFRYVQRYGLAEPCDDIEPVLRHVALAQGRMQKVKVLTGTGNVNVTMLNYPAAACEFLRDFRAGHLGRVTLD
ncbi:mitochondrial ribosome-associated GTPase 1 isoform X3 [Opisthocomus hoazin]|uniref:mitochondrial ribosome-associated GTPase 1 isoform X3 n=1 Tax=Opisthocomus hoazin TaxID=30419 RepID=UPI003F53657B